MYIYIDIHMCYKHMCSLRSTSSICVTLEYLTMVPRSCAAKVSSHSTYKFQQSHDQSVQFMKYHMYKHTYICIYIYVYIYMYIYTHSYIHKETKQKKRKEVNIYIHIYYVKYITIISFSCPPYHILLTWDCSGTSYNVFFQLGN